MTDEGGVSALRLTRTLREEVLLSEVPTRREFLAAAMMTALTARGIAARTRQEAGFPFERFETNGVALRCAVEGSGPLVIMVHGFPELWYSWRHQIQPVADAGFRVVAPDVRG